MVVGPAEDPALG